MKKSVHFLSSLFTGVLVLAIAAASPLSAFAAVLYQQSISTTTYDPASVELALTFTATASGTLHGLSFDAGVGAGDSRSLANIRVEIYTAGFASKLCDDIYSSFGGTTITDSMTNYVGNTSQIGSCNGISITSGSSYILDLVGFDAPQSHNVRMATLGSAASAGAAYMWLDDSAVTSPVTNFTTRFDSFTPAGTVATSTSQSFGAIGYVNAGDFVDGMKVKYSFISNAATQAAVASPSLLTTSYEFPITSSGAFSVSTSTDDTVFQLGEYQLTVFLTKPYISIFGYDLWDTNVLASSTAFTLSTTTAFDKIHDTLQTALNNYASTTDALAACQFNFTSLDFSLAGNFLNCMSTLAIGLVVPTAGQVNELFSDLKNQILQKAPFGYAYLAVADLTGYANVATSTLASSNLTVTFPSTGIFASPTATSSPAGRTITFINFTTLASSTNASNVQSAYSSLDAFFNILFGFAFMMWLWRFAIHHMHP